METDTDLKKEDTTDTISQTEAVKEEANTEAIDKIKMGSNKICIRNDPSCSAQSHAKRLWTWAMWN